MAVLGVILTLGNSTVLCLGVICAIPSPWLETRSEKIVGSNHCESIAHALPFKGLKLGITFPLYICPGW